MRVEVERREFVGLSVTVSCRGCGRDITLYWNGGELDGQSCCDYWYALEHVRTDLVIERNA